MAKKDRTVGGAIAAGSALAGAALGAAAVILSDKKNQEKIKNTIDEISRDAVKIGKDIKKRAGELKNRPQKAPAKKIIVKRTVTKSAAAKPAAVKPAVKKTAAKPAVKPAGKKSLTKN